MSIDEARQQKAMAMLEHQEALEALDALRKKAREVASTWKNAAELAVALCGEYPAKDSEAKWARKRIEDGGRPDLDTLLGLHDEIIAAIERLRVAAEVKKTFGIKS